MSSNLCPPAQLWLANGDRLDKSQFLKRHQVSAPLGQYDSSKLINLGNHRWKIRPEIGASKAIGL
ncbi:MAG: hypothetical protein EWM45_11755 [Rhodopseudomonas palustris]|nr:MAG: hypothetical protein EWM45_11755 [Rhodopseudomonas palustris]